MCFSMIHTASEMSGISGVPSHDPTAISALNVWDDMLCCMKLTSRRPSENARSASVDAAAECKCQMDAYVVIMEHTRGREEIRSITRQVRRCALQVVPVFHDTSLTSD